ncbi:MAG: CoA transferase [Deltaproteobacteria bacterium]|nr:CoA transferase [Deltaproteobacteria bacterium]
MPDKPLSGVTIVDLSRLIPGPFCSLILADLGARVIKMEDPQRGDYLRNISCVYRGLNRNKKILKLDIKSQKGKEAFVRHVKKADILIESFRPGVLKKMGFSISQLHKINRRLIVASITGYGQKGPNKNRAGHDLNYMALSGCLNPPQPPYIQYADLVGGGLFAALAIISALYQRGKKGNGAHLDISMTDSMIFLNLANLILIQGPMAPNILSGILARYRVYPTSDGKFVALAALEDKFWNRFCGVIGKPEWKGKGYVDQAPEIHQQLAAIFASKTRDEWTRLGRENDFCLTPVLATSEVLESAQFRERKKFVKKNGMLFPKTPY